MFDLFDVAESLEISDPSISSSEASPARIYQWLENVLALLEVAPGSGTNSIGSLGNSLPPGFSSKTSLVSFPHTADVTLPSSFEGWGNSGMGGPTGFLTLNMTECHSAGAVSSLSLILEDPRGVPRKYFLSPRACRGILRRAEKRNRELPPVLLQALQAVAACPDPADAKRTTSTQRPPAS